MASLICRLALVGAPGGSMVMLAAVLKCSSSVPSKQSKTTKWLLS